MMTAVRKHERLLSIPQRNDLQRVAGALILTRDRLRFPRLCTSGYRSSLLAGFALFVTLLTNVLPGGISAQEQGGKARTYFIAADELDWNYMPGGRDQMMGMAAEGYAKMYATRGLHSLGPIFRKAMYREYTDATFTHLKPRSSEDAYLGIVGPIVHAEVGDTIRIVFKNHGTHPYSMHPHGVFYDKASEGSGYADGLTPAEKAGDSVAPGATFTYRWDVPERAGPGPADPSSIVWLYHSHVDERRDINTGLFGAIVVTRKGMARPDGTPNDVDREFVAFFITLDELQSWFIDDNIKRFTKDPKKYNKFNGNPVDPDGNVDILLGNGSIATNVRLTINGYQYADGPMYVMKKGDRVRWYVVSLGEGLNFHTPHWHGNTVLVAGRRTDVLSLAPAQMITADMVPDDPGIWLFHCHVSEHMAGGMAARYQVLP
jgi:FtsP/CotA-like multicopper oxidase with cupredoxin domain